MDLTIKKFNELTLTQLYEIMCLRSKVFVVDQQCVYNDVDGKDMFGWHLMLREDDKLAAYLRILEKGQTFNEIAIGRVVTSPDFRRRGFAEKSVSTAIEFVRNTLLETTIRIEAQSYLQKFYETLGFRRCSEEFLDDGIPHVEMVLHMPK